MSTNGRHKRERENDDIFLHLGEKPNKILLQRNDIYQRPTSAQNEPCLPLLQAIKDDNKHQVESLLALGSPIHFFAMEQACKIGTIEIVDALIRYKAFVHPKCLQTCAKYGKTDLFIYLHKNCFNQGEISFHSVDQALLQENKTLFDYITQFPFTVGGATSILAARAGPYFTIKLNYLKNM
jgi:hypothetical protein